MSHFLSVIFNYEKLSYVLNLSPCYHEVTNKPVAGWKPEYIPQSF